ncbi:BREX-1 system adenine-specific DNA-methyltransferase PglX [Pseudomonas helleri]|uniref:BREX-1 system adenine-specific DNA-methyltransferase PglX n=1 Tax=Pseudomonas helleri TaxID=1608996 RepID=UPI003FD6452A
METTKLRRFAQYARRTLMELVEARLQLVLHAGSAARRENAEAIKKLEEAIKSHGEVPVVERVAYIWFNRFCALRFMDVNRYTRIGVVSPAEGQFQPEILAEAKMGHIDDETVPEKIRQQIFSLLAGNAPSHDPQGEAYRLLVVAACNAWHTAMPFLFERIDDYTELLMPDDLLSGNSILAYTREAMTPDTCEDVEVIGWLYQFYISEKKDAVFEGLKKNQKITPANIPAATQLFTPHWIVRYLVENSLGRLWLLNHPSSKLAEQMDYYIRPEQPETDFLKITSPEEIKICDPACGSGHMLTYAFDLLYAIYEEEGYESSEISEKILTHNLYGIEIDERAGELAAFALTMKARAKQRRFFNREIKPNICVLENVKFDEDELTEYMSFVGRDLFTASLQTTLSQFEEADNFGSLIRPEVTDVDGMLRMLDSKDVSGHLFLSQTHQKVLQALQQADYLSQKYHVVIANPPYMGGKGMNGGLKAWASVNYPDSKTDLYAMFMERALALSVDRGFMAMINMQSWMFLSSFEKIREKILSNATILSMAHLGERAFDTIGGAVVSTTAFILWNKYEPKLKGVFLRLVDGNSEAEKSALAREAVLSSDCGWLFNVSANEFRNISGSPIAYWLSTHELKIIELEPSLAGVSDARVGLQTSDNDRFLRLWHEVSKSQAFHGAHDLLSAKQSGAVWFPCNKGGEFRKWYGNHTHYVNWKDDGQVIRALSNPSAEKQTYVRNDQYYFRDSVSWCDITTEANSFRQYPAGFIHDAVGHSEFAGDELWKLSLMAYCNNKFATKLARIINPTIHFHIGYYQKLPFAKKVWHADAEQISLNLVRLSKEDWNAYETSWDFTKLPLICPNYRQPALKATYHKLRTNWREMTQEVQRLEEKNNRIFIDAYGLQDELTADVPLKEITLTCNPYYRYGGVKTEAELDVQLQSDTMAEFLSYAVGCMFGRYSLDKPGLVLANQGDTLAEYLRQIPEPSFMPDKDNVIPLLDGEWFADDVTERFRTFLRLTFGEEYYEENLAFIEQSLGKEVRKYFLKDFYTDHVKRYKKRPIYWLFASPKGTFSVLIYLHRYRSDTVSVVLQYLRDFRKKLAARLDYLQQVGISSSASQGEKTRALKEIETLKKQLLELDDYERDTLYPLATEQVALDLDDGVKMNYLKLGSALKKITGLDAKED